MFFLLLLVVPFIVFCFSLIDIVVFRYFLVNTTTPVIAPCSMYLMLLPLLLLLAWYCYSSCYSLFNTLDTIGPFATPCSSFVDVVVFLVALCLSLVDVVAPLAIPCSMLLFLLLFFVWRYCFSYCSLLDVFNIVVFCSTHLTLLFFLLA